MQYRWITKSTGKLLVLVTGWATDYRIFSGIPHDRPVMIIDRYDPYLLPQQLNELLQKEGVVEPELMGFSMGGYALLEFCRLYPGWYSQLTVIGLRPRYSEKELRYFFKRLEAGKTEELLLGFYQSAVDVSYYEAFSKTLLLSYLISFSGDELSQGIRYLMAFGHLDFLSEFDENRLTFIHGREDKIAPFDALELFLMDKPFRLFCLEGVGHVLGASIDVSCLLECLRLEQGES